MVLLLVFHFTVRNGINNAKTYTRKTGWQMLDSSDLGQGHSAGCCVHSNELCVPQNVRDLQKLKIVSQEWLCSKELVGTSFRLFRRQTNVVITK